MRRLLLALSIISLVCWAIYFLTSAFVVVAIKRRLGDV